MIKARIYRPDKTAMQSGKAGMREWLLVFAPDKAGFIDNLMGWSGMTDMPQEIRLRFPTRKEAIAYATAQHIPFEIWEPHKRRTLRKAYADNFKFDKVTG